MTQKTIDLVIRDAQSAQTVGEIRKQVKALTSEMLRVGEGSADFERLAMAAADLKERMNEANDSVRNFNPDAIEAVGNFASKAAAGVQLVTGAMSLFGSESKETEKALLKVQAAMAFAQGIQGVKDFGKALKGLFAVIQANPVGVLVSVVAALAVEIAVLYNNYQDANSEVAKATRLYEKQKEVTEKLSRQYEREIELLEAQGASEEEIIAIKRKNIEVQLAQAEQGARLRIIKIQEIQDNDSLYESYLRVASSIEGFLGFTEEQEKTLAAIKQNKAERAAEDKKAFDEQIESINDLRLQLKLLDEEEKKINEQNGKEWKAVQDKKVADSKAAWDQMLMDMIAFGDAMYAEMEAQNAAIDAADAAHYERRRQLYAEDVQRKQEAEDRKYRIRKRAAELERKIDEMNNSLRIEGIRTVLSTVGELTKDNAEAQKGVGAALALIDTFIAAQKAYTSQILPGDPTSVARGYIAAGLAVVSGLARVAAILRVDTDNPSAGGGAAGAGSANAGSVVTSSQPTINASAQPTTIFQPPANNTTPPMFVSVTEFNTVNDTVQAMESRSRF
jgi:hypothetical protein